MAIGSYAINGDDKCVFLAADFDKSTWKEDITAYRQTAAEMNVQVATEISKSGNGAHAWIFINDHVPAKEARRLGEMILSRAMDRQNALSLDSCDRFFPNQWEYLPQLHCLKESDLNALLYEVRQVIKNISRIPLMR